MTQVNDSSGVQTGNRNVQINLFSGEQPRGPVVAGSIPQSPPAFQPREDLMSQLRAAGPGVSVVRAITGLCGVGKTQPRARSRTYEKAIRMAEGRSRWTRLR